MKYITEICNAGDLCPKQQSIGITWSAATKSQCRKLVFHTNYFLHFTLSPQMRVLSQTELCLWFFPPHNYRRSTGSNAGNRNEESQMPLELAFCSAVMVRLCSRMVMFPRLCSNAATRWAWNTQEQQSVLFPKKEDFCSNFISPASAWQCVLCKWCRENNPA